MDSALLCAFVCLGAAFITRPPGENVFDMIVLFGAIIDAVDDTTMR